MEERAGARTGVWKGGEIGDVGERPVGLERSGSGWPRSGLRKESRG